MKLHITRSLLATRYSLSPKADPPLEESSNKGQSLTEILIAISVAAIIVGSAAGALIFSVRSNQLNRANQGASPLAQELLDNVRSKAESRWQDIYNLTKTTITPPAIYPYYLNSSLNIVAGQEDEIINPGMRVNNIAYKRYFTIEDVNRNKCGTGEIVSAVGTLCSSNQTGVMDDPSTQKITAKVTWQQGSDISEVSVVEYITRSKNDVNQFTDWSGVSGVAGPVIKPGKDYFNLGGLENPVGSLKLSSPPTGGWLISSTFNTGYTNGAAYNSIMWKGDLGLGTNSAVKFQLATSDNITGNPGGGPTGLIDSIDRYAWNDISGWLNFYDAPGGPVAVTTAKITRWATSSNGDFALDCATTPSGDICSTSNFYVSNNNGNLAGWAWNSTYGWVSFCGGQSTANCPGTIAYQVTINQTGPTMGEFHGWAWNDTIGWISFNCEDPGVCLTSNYKVKVAGAGNVWNYIGPDGSPYSFYTTIGGQGSPVQIVTAHHNNKRYYRYKIYLESSDNISPIVNDVIVNWSP